MTGYKLVRANVETAADAGDKWWKSLDKKQQDQYLKLHPNSKYGKKKDKAPEAPKTKAKPAVVPTKLAGPKLKKPAGKQSKVPSKTAYRVGGKFTPAFKKFASQKSEVIQSLEGDVEDLELELKDIEAQMDKAGDATPLWHKLDAKYDKFDKKLLDADTKLRRAYSDFYKQMKGK